jgi:GNAT superfamily N-acetyltransferase
MDYKVDDEVGTKEFMSLANAIWPRAYDEVLISKALRKTINITARDKGELIGCVRILTDGYLFGTIPEGFVLPKHQGKGIGGKLFSLARSHSPTSLYFGAQPEKESLYEHLGFKKGLQSFEYRKPRS